MTMQGKVDQTCDVAIVGGSFAGLTAALQLGRASRSVVVIDAGQPRNRFSLAAHAVPGWDGVPPSDVLARFRADLAAYPTVRIVDGTVAGVSGAIDSFTLDVGAAGTFASRRVLLAHGVRDILPAIPGLSDGWGKTVLHCPYCHGYEVRNRPLAVLTTGPMATHQAHMLLSDWSRDVTLLTNGVEGLDTAALVSAGLKVDTRHPEAFETGDDARVRFTDGTDARFAAVFTASRADLTGSCADSLGVAMTEGPLGPFVQVGQMQQTSIPGVFAAGDLSSPAPSINFAIGDGARAGIGCHQSMLFPGFIQPVAEAA